MSKEEEAPHDATRRRRRRRRHLCMIRAFGSTHRIVAKKSALLVSPKGRLVSLFSRRLTRGGALREEEEEEEGENMSAIPKGGEEEEEHKVTPEFPKGEEYPSGMDDTQSSFATWEFAQGPFHGKRGFLVTSMFPGSVRVFLFFSFSLGKIVVFF